MIREAAARKLAADLFEQYVKRGLISELGVALAASIIMNHVRTDELQQEIEAIEKRIASKEPA